MKSLGDRLDQYYTLDRMEKCAENGYDCYFECEFVENCKIAKWVCSGCGKKTNFKQARLKVFK